MLKMLYYNLRGEIAAMGRGVRLRVQVRIHANADIGGVRVRICAAYCFNFMPISEFIRMGVGTLRGENWNLEGFGWIKLQF
jgi:hypothetical protein